MNSKETNNILHIHNFNESVKKDLTAFNALIIGGVFCEKVRIDHYLDKLMDCISGIKNSFTGDIFVQEPFFVFGNEEDKLVHAIEKMATEELINGVIVNSFGHVTNFNSHTNLKFVFSRFGIGKRKRTNSHFLNLLLSNNIKTIECFEYDKDLINDILSSDVNIDLWVRKSDLKLNSFSRYCFIKKYTNECMQNNAECQTGKFVLNDTKENFNLTTSGHCLYEEYKKAEELDLSRVGSVVTNSDVYEL